MTDADIELFATKRQQACNQCLSGVDQDKILAEPILFTNFCNGEDDTYLNCAEYEKLNKVLLEKLGEYNEANATMDLVLFEMFMDHVCRIARVLMKPRGNCMCVGVGVPVNSRCRSSLPSLVASPYSRSNSQAPTMSVTSRRIS
jgi:hypothetical protein